jgi:hypothetical protein
MHRMVATELQNKRQGSICLFLEELHTQKGKWWHISKNNYICFAK